VTALRFLPQAQAELLHEVAYDSAVRSGGGARFLAPFEDALVLVPAHPVGGAPSPHGTRSVLLKGFPFSLVYRSGATELLVVAVAPHRRRPGYWLSRLTAR
jgi:hypothetical protein